MSEKRGKKILSPSKWGNPQAQRMKLPPPLQRPTPEYTSLMTYNTLEDVVHSPKHSLRNSRNGKNRGFEEEISFVGRMRRPPAEQQLQQQTTAAFGVKEDQRTTISTTVLSSSLAGIEQQHQQQQPTATPDHYQQQHQQQQRQLHAQEEQGEDHSSSDRVAITVQRTSSTVHAQQQHHHPEAAATVKATSSKATLARRKSLMKILHMPTAEVLGVLGELDRAIQQGPSSSSSSSAPSPSSVAKRLQEAEGQDDRLPTASSVVFGEEGDEEAGAQEEGFVTAEFSALHRHRSGGGDGLFNGVSAAASDVSPTFSGSAMSRSSSNLGRLRTVEEKSAIALPCLKVPSPQDVLSGVSTSGKARHMADKLHQDLEALLHEMDIGGCFPATTPKVQQVLQQQRGTALSTVQALRQLSQSDNTDTVIEELREKVRGLERREQVSKEALRKKSDELKVLQSAMRQHGIVATYRGVVPPEGFVAIACVELPDTQKLWNESPQIGRGAIAIAQVVQRKLLTEYKGFEAENDGDTAVFLFSSVAQAVKWAMELQVSLNAAQWPITVVNALHDSKDTKMAFTGLVPKIALHAGHVELEVDPITQKCLYYGIPLTWAKLMIAHCGRGTTLCSAELFAHSGDVITGSAGRILHQHHTSRVPASIAHFTDSVYTLCPSRLVTRLERPQLLSTEDGGSSFSWEPIDVNFDDHSSDNNTSTADVTTSKELGAQQLHYTPMTRYVEQRAATVQQTLELLSVATSAAQQRQGTSGTEWNALLRQHGQETEIAMVCVTVENTGSMFELQAATSPNKGTTAAATAAAAFSMKTKYDEVECLKCLAQCQKVFAACMADQRAVSSSSSSGSTTASAMTGGFYLLASSCDAQLWAFSSRYEALRFALRCQRAFMQQSWSSAVLALPFAGDEFVGSTKVLSGPRLRIGLHCGTLGGTAQSPSSSSSTPASSSLAVDFDVNCVNLARQAVAMCAISVGGEILCTSDVATSTERVRSLLSHEAHSVHGGHRYVRSCSLEADVVSVYPREYEARRHVIRSQTTGVSGEGAAFPLSQTHAMLVSRQKQLAHFAERLEVQNEAALHEKPSLNVSPPLGSDTVVLVSECLVRDQDWDACALPFIEAVRTYRHVIKMCTFEFDEGYVISNPERADATTLVFGSVFGAARFALQCQEKLAFAQYWPPEVLQTDSARRIVAGDSDRIAFNGLRVRMSIVRGATHVEVDNATCRSHFFGPALKNALELCSIAQPGQILVHESAYSAVSRSSRQLGDPMLDFLGDVVLKGEKAAAKIYSVCPYSLTERKFEPLSLRCGKARIAEWMALRQADEQISYTQIATQKDQLGRTAAGQQQRRSSMPNSGASSPQSGNLSVADGTGFAASPSEVVSENSVDDLLGATDSGRSKRRQRRGSITLAIYSKDIQEAVNDLVTSAVSLLTNHSLDDLSSLKQQLLRHLSQLLKVDQNSASGGGGGGSAQQNRQNTQGLCTAWSATDLPSVEELELALTAGEHAGGATSEAAEAAARKATARKRRKSISAFIEKVAESDSSVVTEADRGKLLLLKLHKALRAFVGAEVSYVATCIDGDSIAAKHAGYVSEEDHVRKLVSLFRAHPLLDEILMEGFAASSSSTKQQQQQHQQHQQPPSADRVFSSWVRNAREGTVDAPENNMRSVNVRDVARSFVGWLARFHGMVSKARRASVAKLQSGGGGASRRASASGASALLLSAGGGYSPAMRSPFDGTIERRHSNRSQHRHGAAPVFVGLAEDEENGRGESNIAKDDGNLIGMSKGGDLSPTLSIDGDDDVVSVVTADNDDEEEKMDEQDQETLAAFVAFGADEEQQPEKHQDDGATS